MEWTRRSQRLWVAVSADGRTFRIERSSIARGSGPVWVSEQDSLLRETRKEPAKDARQAKTIAERWSKEAECPIYEVNEPPSS